MAKKVVEGIVSELKKLIGDGKLVLGRERTIKLLRDGKLVKVYLSSDCSEDALSELEHECSVFDIPFEKLSKTSVEIGVICRKPFSISVIGVLE